MNNLKSAFNLLIIVQAGLENTELVTFDGFYSKICTGFTIVRSNSEYGAEFYLSFKATTSVTICIKIYGRKRVGA